MTRRTMLATMGLAAGANILPRLAGADNAGQVSTKAGQSTSTPVCLADFEPLAKERLSHFAYEYIASGAADELTIRWNREAFDQIRLRPRVLVDVETIDTRIELFGQKLSHPILLAPTARHRLAHPEGEVETARGASTADATFVVSSLSTRRLEDISAAAKSPL